MEAIVHHLAISVADLAREGALPRNPGGKVRKDPLRGA